MASNWNPNFIDLAASTPALTVGKAGHVFVDIYRATNGDGTPDNPYNSLRFAVENTNGGSIVNGTVDEFGFPVFTKVIVLASGLYQEFDIGSAGDNFIEIIANQKGTVQFLGTGSETILNRSFFTEVKFTSIDVNNCSHMNQGVRAYIRDCFLELGGARNSPAIGNVIHFGNCWLYDYYLQATNTTDANDVAEIKLINCTTRGNTIIQNYFDNDNTRFASFEIIKSDLGTGTEIRINNELINNSQAFDDTIIRDSNNRATIVNIDGGSTLITEQNNINVDPQDLGDPTKRQVLLNKNSPLYEMNIGAVGKGQIITTQVLSNQVISGSFNQPRIGVAFPYFGGASNANTPDSTENTDIPTNNTISVSYSSTVGGAKGSTTQFLCHERTHIDSNGNGNGSIDFDPNTKELAVIADYTININTISR